MQSKHLEVAKKCTEPQTDNDHNQEIRLVDNVENSDIRIQIIVDLSSKSDLDDFQRQIQSIREQTSVKKSKLLKKLGSKKARPKNVIFLLQKFCKIFKKKTLMLLEVKRA